MDLQQLGASRRVASWMAGVLLALSPAVAAAALSLDDTTRLAREQAPSLLAQQQQVAGSEAARQAAGSLPVPRLTLGVGNRPLGGADRFSLTRDFMTMQRIGLVQEVPNRAKRAAREVGAQARIERDRAMLVVAERAVTREASLAWLAVHFAERRAAQLVALVDENRLLQDTLAARIANGKAMPADRTMAQQEALALADRHDDVARDIARARAGLRRWVGERAAEPLAGEPPALPVPSELMRNDLHRHVELLGDLEELAEQAGDRDFVQRLAQDRLPDRTAGLGEGVDRLGLGHVAGLEMHLGDAAVRAEAWWWTGRARVTSGIP